jgi:hypothetical protein
MNSPITATEVANVANVIQMDARVIDGIQIEEIVDQPSLDLIEEELRKDSYISAEDIEWLDVWIDKTAWEAKYRGIYEVTNREYADGELMYEHTWYHKSDTDLEKYSLDDVIDLNYYLMELRQDAIRMNNARESGYDWAAKRRVNLMSEIAELRDRMERNRSEFEYTELTKEDSDRMIKTILNRCDYPENIKMEMNKSFKSISDEITDEELDAWYQNYIREYGIEDRCSADKEDEQ